MESISSLKLADLKKELRERNLPVTGTKQILVDRLLEAMAAEKAGHDDSNIDDLLDEDSMLGDEESDSSDGNTVPADITISSPTATVPPVSLPSPVKESLKRSSTGTGQNGTNGAGSPPSKKKIILNRQPVPEEAPQVLPVPQSATAESVAISKAESKESLGDSPDGKAVIKLSEAEVSATDKLKLRQEKFKTELPTTTEAASLLQKRAERFGVANAGGKPTVATGEDAAKLAKRQERFGVTTDDKVNELRQKRAARFGLAEKSGGGGGSVSSTTNSAELEEKKKLRAARFATSSLS